MSWRFPVSGCFKSWISLIPKLVSSVLNQTHNIFIPILKDPHLSGKGKADFQNSSRSIQKPGASATHQRVGDASGTGMEFREVRSVTSLFDKSVYSI